MFALKKNLDCCAFGRQFTAPDFIAPSDGIAIFWLAAEDVGVTRAAARHPAVDSKLDRQGRVEFHVVGDLRSIDAEDPADGSAREDAAVAHQVISGAIGEDNVEV
jgi:hypothetical protein